MNEWEDAFREFLVESHEHLDQLDRDLLALEKSPADPDRLASIFRTLHTLKGTAGFFELPRLQALAHAGEHLMARLRDGKLSVTPPLINTLLRLVDVLRAGLHQLEQTRHESAEDHSALLAELTQLSSHPSSSPLPGTMAAEESTVSELVEGNLRIDVGLLDRLMNLVGELVLSRNQILQLLTASNDSSLTRAGQRLNQITTELQDSVMKTRMQPIGNIWDKLPRLVRDLALSCGKQVRVSFEGKETELDKTILEAIKGSLTHLVRNAIDHGLETPEERRRAGKPEEGVLLLRAYHEGGQVHLEIHDDGRGLNPARIRQKALERGLIDGEQSVRLSERELIQLIFLPGFSTADQVTAISGRGVGMDVVKTSIEKLGGTVNLQSRPGQGTTVRLKIPLTLAIIPALIVTSAGERYAIPQLNVLELLYLDSAQVPVQIESLFGVPVYRLRGELLPLVRLDQLLGTKPSDDANGVSIVVLQADHHSFGLIVDAIHDTEEIVVKPLGKHLMSIRLYAGSTILGDGRIALILDVRGTAQTAGIITMQRENSVRIATPTEQANKTQTQTILLVEARPNYRLALPLERVVRLEELKAESVELAQGRPAVSYRGEVLPLVHLNRLLPGEQPSGESPSTLQVVVCSQANHRVGLVVDRILDILDTPLEVSCRGATPGILGTAIVQERIIDLLDVNGLLSIAGVQPL